MIKGFEHITKPLTEYEQSLLESLCVGLKVHQGKNNIVSNKKIRKWFASHGHPTSCARIRKMINYIRMKHLIEGLIATSKGYYVAVNSKDILEHIQSLDGRIKAIQAVRDELEKDYRKRIYGQQK